MDHISDVLTCLKNYADMDSYTPEQLMPSCERGLLWVLGHLKSGTDKNHPLIIHTAAAIAHYYFFLSRMSETDKFESYTAGDMTVRRNLEKEMSFESRSRDEAIAAASSILVDGGFFFRGK